MWATLHDNLSFGSPLPPLAPLPPLRSTLSSLSNQISFSPSPSTIFHFIKLSYHKLNESSARFLLLFLSQPAPFTIFPLQLTPPPPPPPPIPQFSTSPSDSACCPLWILPHTESSGRALIPQRRLCQLMVLGAESGSSRPRVQSRGSVPLQDYAEFNSLPLTPEVGRPRNKESLK